MIKMEYAIKDDKLVHISEVASGSKCLCFCPSCKDRLIAKKGKSKRHHFAHSSSDCSHGLESALHIMAKEILQEEKRLFLPEVNIQLPHLNFYKAILNPEGIMEFDKAILEKKLGGIVPDIIVYKGNQALLIEIYVTHRVDDDKLKLIRNAGISAVEVDLSRLENMPSREELRIMLTTDRAPIYWLYNKKRDYYWDNWLMRCEKLPLVFGGYTIHVNNCPIQKREWQGKYYADLCNDCWHCDYYIWPVYDNKKNETGIYCSGKTGIKTLKALKEYLSIEKDGRT